MPGDLKPGDRVNALDAARLPVEGVVESVGDRFVTIRYPDGTTSFERQDKVERPANASWSKNHDRA